MPEATKSSALWLLGRRRTLGGFLLGQPFLVHLRLGALRLSGVSDEVSPSAVTRRAPTFSARSFTRRRSPGMPPSNASGPDGVGPIH
jgi:hypothetical protein